MGELLHEETLLQRFARVIDHKNRTLRAYGGSEQSLHDTYLQFLEYGRRLRDRIVPTHPMIQGALRRGDRILLEGAQGVLLDVDWGTYPCALLACARRRRRQPGAGIAPRDINHVPGIFKAYSTRVGEGPFPTELNRCPWTASTRARS